MSATVKQKKKNRFEECQVAPGALPEKGHLPPEAKVNSIGPCMGQVVSPISVICYKRYIRKVPFVFGAQPWDANLPNEYWPA
jgi:hypothetical protein